MKTTLELDDALFIEAKAVAARRRITLKAMVEHALRRELAPSDDDNPNPDLFEVGPLGLLRLKRRHGETVTLEQIEALQQEVDDEDLQRALNPRR